MNYGLTFWIFNLNFFLFFTLYTVQGVIAHVECTIVWWTFVGSERGRIGGRERGRNRGKGWGEGMRKKRCSEIDEMRGDQVRDQGKGSRKSEHQERSEKGMRGLG